MQPKATWDLEDDKSASASLGMIWLMLESDGSWTIENYRTDDVYASGPAPTGPFDTVTQMLACEQAYLDLLEKAKRFEPIEPIEPIEDEDEGEDKSEDEDEEDKSLRTLTEEARKMYGQWSALCAEPKLEPTTFDWHTAQAHLRAGRTISFGHVQVRNSEQGTMFRLTGKQDLNDLWFPLHEDTFRGSSGWRLVD